MDSEAPGRGGRKMLRVVTLFSGYDSQCMALDRLGIEYELVAWAEIDKYAIAAHNAVYPQWKDRNMGDVSKADWSKIGGGIDLLTYSSPCQDFSQAGLMRGGEEGSGTRSSLLWEVKRAIEVLQPRYLLMENVKNLVSKKFIGLFNDWLKVLEEYGYENRWQVLNAKDFDVPQNRERVFVVSGKDGLAEFGFPRKEELKKRLRDVLEPEVDEKYYLSAEQVGKILEHCERKQLEGCGFGTAFRNHNEIATAVTTRYGSRETDTYIVEDFYQERDPRVYGEYAPTIRSERNGLKVIEVCGLSRSRDKSGKVVKRNLNPYVNCLHTGIGGHCRENMEVFVTEVVAGALRGRGSTGQYVQKLELNEEGVTNTLTSVEKDNLIVEYGGRLVRIRRLTPREAFRLMDMDECNIDKIMSAGISNTQMYKMAGNSIVVEPMYRIFRNLLTPENSDIIKDTLF